MSPIQSVAVIGASGFVGSSVTRALDLRGYRVDRIAAPRLPDLPPNEGAAYIEAGPAELHNLIDRLQHTDGVVNAAGLSEATSGNLPRLIAANGILPGLVAAACATAGIGRLVHVSSAAVQGRLPTLDDSDSSDAFSAYSRSKLLGEEMVRRFAPEISVIYRPAGVHGIDRRVTQRVARVAAGPFASVAGRGERPSPQSLIENVGDAIAFLVTTDLNPPAVVTHPWEGLTTGDVMELLGGHAPRQIPSRIARATIGLLGAASRLMPRLSGSVRRVEMLWFGQGQAISWLSTAGWDPPLGRSSWAEIGTVLRNSTQVEQTMGPAR